MTTLQDLFREGFWRDAEAVRHGPLPTQVSMAPVTSGAPFAYEDVIADTGREFFAVWACDPGVYPRVKDKRGSFMYLLDGAGQIVDDDGTAHELAPEAILILPFGWRGHWNITSTVRKVYLHTTPEPPFKVGVQSSCFVPAAQLSSGDLAVFDGPDGRCTVRTTAPGTYPGDGPRFSYVMAGEASVTGAGAGGGTAELTAGSAIAFPDGWSGSWHVRTPLRTFDVLAARPEGSE